MPTFELPRLYVRTVVAQVVGGRPVVLNRDPGPGERGVPLDSSVALEVVDPGPDGIDRGATRVWLNGVLAFDGGAPSEVQPDFAGPRATVLESSDTLRLVLDPLLPFSSEAMVLVRVVSSTPGGGHLLDQTYSFVAEDRTAPQLVAAQAVAPTIVQLGFNESLSSADPQQIEFEALDTPAVSVAPIEASIDGSVVTVVLDTVMTPTVRYQVAVLEVLDLRKNPIDPNHARAVFPGFVPPRPRARQFDLWHMIPQHNRRDDETGDLRRFIACLQEVLDYLLVEVDRYSDIYDIERAPSEFLDLILFDLGNPFSFNLSELGQRRLAAVLVEMYRQKGTALGIQNAVRFFLGIDITTVLPFRGNTLILGESELGIDWELGPSDRFSRYAFSIEVDRILTPTERRQIRAIVDYLKPVNTHFVELIEPIEVPKPEHWELGVSELDVTTTLHE